MSKKNVFAIITLAIFIVGIIFITASTEPIEKDSDSEALAQKLVNNCAGIKEGDLVVIVGGVRDVTLLEDISVNVRRQGAFPLLTIGSDRLTTRIFNDVPVKFDSQVPKFNYELAQIIDAVISVDYNESMDLLADVPPERFEVRNAASADIDNIIMDRNVRQVSLGNGLYPTTQRAEIFALTLDELTDIFWNGVNVDYTLLNNKCNLLKNALSSSKMMRITNDNGTDFSVQIEGRPIFISDGIISEDDLITGGAACQVWLPAGEVYLTPVPGTAEGTIILERQYYAGKEILNLNLTFANGKLTNMTAESGLEPLMMMYDAAGAGKDQFAIVDLGVNPNVKINPDSRLVAWMAEGMITICVGNDEWAGGSNETSFFMANFLPGSTLTLDGETIIEKGSLKY